MNIVFYSSNSNYFNEKDCIFTTIPSWQSLWNEFCNNHKEHNFYTVTQKPAFFMPENSIFIESHKTSDFVDTIKNLNPDLVIALTFWVTPFDWLPVKDAIIAEELRECGIKTICHSKETAMICFDKYRTMNFFKQYNFNYAPGLFIDHDLFFCAGNQKEVEENVYKECVYSQLKRMEYPLIIKDTIGLSSYGMTVIHSYNEAYGYLNSKKNNSNRLIEQFIPGEQFGTEIYGSKGNYIIMPPLRFSVNQYGITSPKLSQKSGPVLETKYKLDELYKELDKLTKNLDLNGFAQVDLVFHNDKWYIIEINPRLSGMTTTYCAAMNMNFYEYVYSAINGTLNSSKMEAVINKKIPISDISELEKLFENENVRFISQINNLAAKQERETGYCEIISVGEKN